MMEISFWTVIIAICNIVFCIVFTGAICYLFFLLVKALKKYINTKEVREEKSVIRKSLGAERKSYPLQNDAGICVGNIRRKPTGCVKMGNRRVRPKHLKFDCSRQSVWSVL